MSKIKEYINIETKILKKFFPEKTEEELKEVITEIIKGVEQEIKENPKYDFMVEFPDNTPSLSNVSLNSIESKLEKDKPIITKYGTCFYRQDQNVSILASLLEYLAGYRKKVKKQMFEHINDEDQTEFNKLDTIQKTIKILMNSFYGVLIAKGSIFYSPDCGASITYSGELIIMTAISIFERFLSNNIKFYSLSDIITYCDNIIEEDYKIDKEYNISFKKNISKTDLYKYLINHYYDLETQSLKRYKLNKNDIVATFISKLTPYEINKIYYKNNFMEFLDNCIIEVDGERDDILVYFKAIFESTFLDPNEPDEEQKDLLDSILDVLKDYVFYNYQNFFKFWECHDGDRETVLTVDTDSNYLYLGPYYEYFKSKFPDIIDDSKEKIVTVVNSITYFLTYVINQTYMLLTESSNIPESHRPLINMKNEFLISRIMLTKNKKQYAYSAILREGNIIENPKLEIKGLPIKKVNVNRNVREYFSNILDKNIINADEIDYPLIIGEFFKLADIIKKSLKNGETKYSIPEKANSISSYVEPFNQQSIRGSILWNELYPEDEITFPTKLNLFKINIPKNIDYIKEKISNYIKENNIEKTKNLTEEYNQFIKIMEKIINDKELEKLFKENVLNVICFPKSLKKIPLFIIPFINIDGIIGNHLSTAATILDALDINTPKVNKVNIPSNFIKF